MSDVARIRDAIERRGGFALLEESERLDAQIDDAFAAVVDRFEAAIAPDRMDDSDRAAIVKRFEALPRSDYRTPWRKAGCLFGTPLHSAACREYTAREMDALFPQAVRDGMITAAHDAKGRLLGLAALLRVVEAAWAAAHRPLAKAKVDRAA